MKSTNLILAIFGLLLAMMSGIAPTQAAPMAQARALEVAASAAVTDVGYRHRRYNRHSGYGYHGYRRHYGFRQYRYRNFGYRNYSYRNYGFYPNNTFGGLTFHIGPRYRHY